MNAGPLSAAVGRRLQQLRLHAGIPLGRVARKVGMTASALRQIEEGGAQPSIGTLNNLAGHLGTSVPELVRDAKQARIAPAASGTPMGLGQIARAIVQLPDGVDKLEAVEAVAVRYAFEVSGGNKSGAARLLGMQRKALERRLKRSLIGRG